MAIYRLSVSHITRPHSALHAAAYRGGHLIEYNENTYDYTHRRDIIETGIILPENAPCEYKDPRVLWGAAEKAEDASTRRNEARVAHEVLVALPRELTSKSWHLLVKELINNCFTQLGMCADYAIHRGDFKDEDRPISNHIEVNPHNPHAHILLSTRHIDRNGFSKRKAREWESWNNPVLLKSWREEWENIQNRMFERQGLEVRVDHRRGRKNDKKRNRGHSKSR